MHRQARSAAVVLVVVGGLVVLLSAIAFANGLPPGGTFTDDNGNIHEGNIEAIAAEGVTRGCNPPTNDLYCPGSSVTRGQMAAFLTRALDLPATATDFFVDDNDSIFESDINRMAAAGVTKGCNPSEGNTNYCPDGKVTRGQMAAFLVRAFGYTDNGGGDLFIDDDDSIFEGDIDRLGTAGVTKGCNPPVNDRYCPDSPVLRDQMASLLGRTLGLDPIVPPPDADLYVSSIRGDDSNSGTTPNEPWKSLDKAARAVQPGQTIHLERGSRWSETLKLDIEATDTHRVRVLPYGSGAAPIIEGQSTCIRASGSNITVEGISVRNCSWSGITISGDNNVVEGNHITGNAAGIYVKSGANRNAVRHNTLVDNNVMSVLTEGGSDDSGAFGILVHGDNTDIGYNTISGSNAFSYDYGWDGAAIEIYGGQDNYIHHNYAADNDTFIELGESRSRGNIVVYNVVISSLDTSVFLVTRGAESSRGAVTGTIADNNSVYLTGVSSQGFVCHGGCSPDILTLRNNIIEARWKVGYSDGSFNGDYNIFHGGKQQFEIGPHTIVADPLWVNPDAGDLRLQINSPAIDLGTPLGYTTDIDGTTVPTDGNSDGHPAPDAGAYEYEAQNHVAPIA